MKIAYFLTAGTGDATRASIPLHLAANGSTEVGQEPSTSSPSSAITRSRSSSEKGCAVARGATDEDLRKVGGSWVTPPGVAKLFADSDRVVTF